MQAHAHRHTHTHAQIHSTPLARAPPQVGALHSERFRGHLDDFRFYPRALGPLGAGQRGGGGGGHGTRIATATSFGAPLLSLTCARGSRAQLRRQWRLLNGAQCTTQGYCALEAGGVKLACEEDQQCAAFGLGGRCVRDLAPVQGALRLELVPTVRALRYTANFQARTGQSLSVSVPAARVVSITDNMNLAASPLAVTVFTDQPQPSLRSAAPQPTRLLHLPLTITFDQRVSVAQGLGRLRVAASGGSRVLLSGLSAPTVGRVWTLNLTMLSVEYPAETIAVTLGPE